jgi:multiple sugar transport system ATP-binding protein
MASITLKNIEKVFDKNKRVIDDFSLKIADGEFTVLVGPSGCGKSTLLRIIAGLGTPTAGEILIDDVVINAVAPKDRNVAMVFQNYALYPHMTVFDNLGFGLKLRKMKKDKIQKQVEKAAQILEIEDLLDRKPKQLSGGQRQRVALGRAIVRDPNVFLFDEPLSNLDAKLRVHMRAEIKRLHKRLGTTMVYVTHDQVEAMTIGDRIVILKDGIIQQIGSPLDVYNNPLNMFVAGFIGAPPMNFIPADLQNGWALVGQDKIDITNIQLTDTALTEKRIVMGVRPEDILFSDKGLPYTFVLDELLGNESLVHVVVNDTPLIIREFITNAQQKRSPRIKFNTANIRLFSPESGIRLDSL